MDAFARVKILTFFDKIRLLAEDGYAAACSDDLETAAADLRSMAYFAEQAAAAIEVEKAAEDASQPGRRKA